MASTKPAKAIIMKKNWIDAWNEEGEATIKDLRMICKETKDYPFWYRVRFRYYDCIVSRIGFGEKHTFYERKTRLWWKPFEKLTKR